MKSCRTSALLILLLILLMAAGCSTPSSNKGQPAGGRARAVHFDAGLAQKVMDMVKTVPGVKDAAAIVMDRDVLAGIKVTGFDRLRLNAIQKDVRNKVKAISKGYNVQVTADKKLFAELQETGGQITAGAFTPDQIQQKVGKIKKEMYH